MSASELYFDREDWETRFASAPAATVTARLDPTSRLRRIASEICDAFELFGYEGLTFPLP
jgi:hypothetical protein